MRYVLIDRLLEVVAHERAVAEKVFDPTEELFRDHFPGRPIVPGALLTEAMSQTAGWLIAASLEFAAWPLLSMTQSAKFRRFAMPGDPLRIEAVIVSMQTTACLAKATVTRNGERIADATLSFQILPLDEIGEARDLFAAWTRTTYGELVR